MIIIIVYKIFIKRQIKDFNNNRNKTIALKDQCDGKRRVVMKPKLNLIDKLFILKSNFVKML